jgi:hypothetical protein
VITPQPGSFTIPAAFDYTDVDYAVSTGGPYTEHDLASVPSATEDGVTVVPGSSGSITIELNSSTGLSAGDRIRLYLGSNAVYGTTGDEFLTNPSSTGSYVIQINSRNASGAAIDDGATRVSIVPQVGISAQVYFIPPQRSNGLPSGPISHGNGTIEISLNTDKLATCRYATTTGVAYADMTGTFLQSTATLHTRVLSGHVDGTTYTYYVRCVDTQGATNEDDYSISFSLEATPTIPVSTGQTGGSQTYNPGGGGQGTIPAVRTRCT